jgi:tetratricopeptide (TPR) repeat protein
MDPVINPAKPLRLFDLGADAFQRLCRALFREMPPVRSAEIYGTSGQRQRGIDIEITLHSGRRWAAQCKACETAVLKHLKKAVEDFLPHLPFWKGAGVEKFVVLVGCGVERTDVLDARRQYESDFAEHQISFELWDSSEIRRHLRQMRSVVEQFLPHWLDEICGTAPNVTLSGGQSKDRPSISPALIAELGTTHNERLDHIRDLIRAGKEVLAESELRQMPTTAAWTILPPHLQARAFRLLAGIALNRRGDVDEARKFLGQAKEIYPTGRFVVTETVIRHIAEGPTAAIEGMPDPIDRDEWNLRAALLINAGRADEALRSLQAPTFEPDAETFRLRALVHLFRRELAEAKVAATEADARASEWVLVQQAVALTEYFSGIAPVFEGWNHWRWPLPLAWHLVRSDAESRAAFRRASERFARIANNQDRGSEDWQQTVGWQLACVANDSARQAEAAELSREILAINPATVSAIVWAIARDYDFAQDIARQALEALCNKVPANTEPVQALFSLLASDKKFAEAGQLLDAHRELYERVGLAGPWRFQRAQVCMAEGDAGKAQALLAEQTDPDLRERTRAAFARISALSSGWTAELLTQLDAEARRTGSEDSLFAACEAYHFAGRHDYVVERAEGLVRRLRTEPALRLALDACASARRYDRCVTLMEQYRAVFRDGDFPPAIRRLRAICLRELGRLLEAEQEFRLLADDKGLPEDRYHLFQLQLSTGKITEASTTARTLLDEPNITPEGLFEIAEKLRPDDPDLARTFFAQATQRGIQTPQGAALGMHVGFNLGLDDEIAGLMQKALSDVDRPDSPLKPFTLEQILEMDREWSQNRSDLEVKYRRGEIPIHAFAHAVRVPLASFFHLTLAANESTSTPPNQNWSLRARYGAWREPALISETERKSLFLDITTLMLAAHIDVLSALEAEYAPIGISSWVMESLRAQIETLTAGQPARVPPKEEVLELLAEGQIATLRPEDLPAKPIPELMAQMGNKWCGLLDYVRREGGWLVDFLPVTSNDVSHTPVVLTEDITPFVRGAGDVFDALQGDGELSSAQVATAQIRLGSMLLNRGGKMQLGKGKKVVLEMGLAEQLANAELLRLLATRADIVIHADEAELLRHELRQLDNREQGTIWLRHLRERLRSGLDSGIYREEPNPEPTGQFADAPGAPELRCLRDFINLQRSSSTLSCCDDRMLSRLSHLGESQVLGLFDLLWNLRNCGKLSAQQLFAYLHRLRAANVRYLPPSVEEIVDYIRNARIQEHELIETPELATLRRYSAACLLDWGLLQRLPPDHPEALERSEILFVPGVQNTIQHAIAALWKDDQLSPSACVAGSDWIMEALWFDPSGLPAFSDPPAPPTSKLVGMSEAQLVLEALSVQPTRVPGSRNDKRTVYLAWLFSRLGGERHRIKHLAADLKRVILALIRDRQSERERQAARNLIAGLFFSLPEAVNSAISFTREELRVLRWENFPPVTFGNIVFDGRTFWPAAQRALMGHPSVIAANTPKGEEFSVTAGEPAPALAIAAKSGSMRFRVTEPALALLNGNHQQRLACLMDLRRNLDQSVAEANSLYPKLARKKRIELLMREVVELRSDSFVSQLSAVSEKITQKQQLDFVLARPRGERSLLQHLRLPWKFADGELPNLLEAIS